MTTQEELENLRAENAELKQDFDDCYADYQALGRTVLNEYDRYEALIEALTEEIAELKMKLETK